MKIVVDKYTMKHIDDYAINQIGIPSLLLMERAALAVTEKIKERITNDDKILAVCGTGNNGADAIASSRILKLLGYSADVVILGDRDKCSKESNFQINIAEKLGISIYNNVDIKEYTIIIDGMFGIGLNSPVRGKYLDYIKQINNENTLVYSVDIPSGVSATDGKILGYAVKADYTITFGYNKIGLILYPGCDYGGQVTVADIGFPKINYKKEDYKYYIFDDSDLFKLPKRENDSHKGSYGKVLVIAGRAGMNGACYLASKAAYRSGAGLVKALISEENRVIMQTMLPEAITSTYREVNSPENTINVGLDNLALDTRDKEQVLSDISWANVISIGPGLGRDRVSRELLELVLKNAKVPLVIDADGINILGEIINEKLEIDVQDTEETRQKSNYKDKPINISEIEKRIKILDDIFPPNTILTPHLKELSRLLNININQIKDNIFDIINICTKDNEIIFVIKDARTIVAFNNNRFINTSGNSGMSTGGSGDVLTGIIASLIGQGLNPCEGAQLGVYVHGLAGDIATRNKNAYSIIASDLIDCLVKI